MTKKHKYLFILGRAEDEENEWGLYWGGLTVKQAIQKFTRSIKQDLDPDERKHKAIILECVLASDSEIKFLQSDTQLLPDQEALTQ